jgi:hypothetical protein
MPGVPTAQLLTYAEVVDVDMAADNDVNFADVEDYGHRVVVEMDKTAMNDYLGWERAIGTARPAAKLNAAKEVAFKAAIEAALGAGFVDIDGVTNGLHFGTANMDNNLDSRLRADGVSANDIPLCFVLYKLYGKSSVQTLDNIFNLQDAHGMLTNSVVAAAITESFKTAEAGALDTMFRDLLAADPHRFFDEQGTPFAGIFETNVDAAGTGIWNITDNDTLEIKLKLIFNSEVTRRGVAGREHLLSETGSAENQQTVISPGDYFFVRLQLKAIPPPGPFAPNKPTSLVATGGTKSVQVSFTAGSDGGSAITNYMYSLNGGAFAAFSPTKTTSPVTISGLADATTYTIRLKAVNAIGEGAISSSVTATTNTLYYTRFTATKGQLGQTTELALQEIGFQNNGTAIDLSSVTLSAVGGNGQPPYEGLAQLVDNNINTKMFPINGAITFTSASPLVFNSYTLGIENIDGTQAGGSGRVPIRWKLESSSNGSTWTMLDDKTGADQAITAVPAGQSRIFATIGPFAV